MATAKAAPAKTAAKPAVAAKPATAKPAAKPSTALAVKKPSTGALVSIQAQMKADLAALADKTQSAGGDKIKLKPGKFVLPDGSETDSLDIVIVDFISANTFYEGAYNKDDIVPPTCFALGTNPTQLVPSDNSPVKQSDTCASCPMNQFGSAGAGKACKNGRRLAVLPPDADDDTPLWTLDVSPTGLKGFDGYVRSTAAKFGITPIGLITNVTLDPNVDYPKLVFGDPRPNEAVEVHWARKAEALDRLTQEPDVSSYGVVAPPKSRTTAKRPAPRR